MFQKIRLERWHKLATSRRLVKTHARTLRLYRTFSRLLLGLGYDKPLITGSAGGSPPRARSARSGCPRPGLFARPAQLTALGAGGPPAVPVKSLSHFSSGFRILGPFSDGVHPHLRKSREINKVTQKPQARARYDILRRIARRPIGQLFVMIDPSRRR